MDQVSFDLPKTCCLAASHLWSALARQVPFNRLLQTPYVSASVPFNNRLDDMFGYGQQSRLFSTQERSTLVSCPVLVGHVDRVVEHACRRHTQLVEPEYLTRHPFHHFSAERYSSPSSRGTIPSWPSQCSNIPCNSRGDEEPSVKLPSIIHNPPSIVNIHQPSRLTRP